MTELDVHSRLVVIRQKAEAGDDAAAHALEDQLYRELVEYFASTGNGAAQKALESASIPFARHCA